MSSSNQDKENCFTEQVFRFFNKTKNLSKIKSLLIPNLLEKEDPGNEFSYSRGFSKSIFDRALWSKAQEENDTQEDNQIEPPKLR